MMNLTTDERNYLISICNKCRKANKGCVKENAYIGLCARKEREAQEIINGYRLRRDNK